MGFTSVVCDHKKLATQVAMLCWDPFSPAVRLFMQYCIYAATSMLQKRNQHRTVHGLLQVCDYPSFQAKTSLAGHMERVVSCKFDLSGRHDQILSPPSQLLAT